LGWLSRHFKVRYSRRALQRHGFLAGTDEQRLIELDSALRCPDSRAIVAVRGGFGSGALAHLADFPAMVRNPKWLIGFSDVTALHVECQRLGLASLHAHNLTGLGRADETERGAWLQALLDPRHTRKFQLRRLTWGDAQGPLVGGNLTLLHQAALAGRFRPPLGSLLFVEEVGEAPYRIARLLLGLEQAGIFDRIGALIVGDVSDAPLRSHGVDSEAVFRAAALRNGFPLAVGLPAGHLRHNAPLVLGCPARLEQTELTLDPLGVG
jgi:muramoyltetrapeptide carboxypeptidase